MPRFAAVVTAPPPIGFVRNSTSPARPVELRTTARGCTTPVTAIPYFGSGSSIECPPTIGTPASAAISAPPARMRASVSAPWRSSENATTLSAVSGCAPIAYTSDSAFAAAILPNSCGSSTIGVKKSTVCTSASSSEIRYTPASSHVSEPTSKAGWCCSGSLASTSRS